MTAVYNYDADTGCLLGTSVTDANPLAPSEPLLPAYAAVLPPPETGERECACYLTPNGRVPAHHAEGTWTIQPDWRDVKLWSKEDGRMIVITEPAVTPEERGATTMPYPGPGYVWRDEQWQSDPALQHKLAEQRAEQELARRQAEATAEIARITPAVDGGYAKPSDVELLPQWQRYLYELPDTRERPGWPDNPTWMPKPNEQFF
ncbi:TPA: tail fiber assembly protein [Aeromonas veronii]